MGNRSLKAAGRIYNAVTDANTEPNTDAIAHSDADPNTYTVADPDARRFAFADTDARPDTYAGHAGRCIWILVRYACCPQLQQYSEQPGGNATDGGRVAVSQLYAADRTQRRIDVRQRSGLRPAVGQFGPDRVRCAALFGRDCGGRDVSIRGLQQRPGISR